MNLSTEGIVLKTYKFQENNLIAHLYTLHSGIQRFVIKGFSSKRARSKYAHFQPMSVIELVYVNKPNVSLQKILESRAHILFLDLPTDPIKISLGLAMLEIFNDCVREQEPNPALYHFLKETLVSLDHAEKRFIHIFLHFLVHLSGFLGFLPLDTTADEKSLVFDVVSGRVESAPNSAGDRIAFLLRELLRGNRVHAQGLLFTQEEKRFLLKTIFQYYTQHVEGFKYPQTLKVFAEIFNG